ncbi:fibroblast growth factor receptor-like 1 isoform X2 [Anneissia japonica]|uniref:fibroblast growth factor receptor-like 1 isoform X2 n=1 Tax=Anneissia japonica TaxID=1529436 RepID=UPI001425832E|nr:fibroblast growth factor receptor-like 1 isoform X2 [Anneissia japonica]
MEGIHLIYLLVLFCFWKVTYCDEPQSLPLGPPQVAGTVNPEQRTRVGRTIKLECPAIGSPPPLIIWKKQDERIRTDWERYKINKDRPSLKIKNVQMEDAGEFVCQATNGFGSVNIKYTLTVIESKPKTEESLNPDDTTGTSPKFIKQLKMRKKTRVKPKGGTVHMNCKATGHPRPDIYWKKDGKNLTDDVLGTTKRGPSTLSLTKLKAEDSGVYTCIVSNRNGQINATYKLEVVDQPPIEVPRLIDELPVNTTVKYGETTSFQCKVQSEIVPHIQWLKRVEQHNKLKNSNTTIDMDGQEFIVLPPGQIAPQRDGTYLNKLTIIKATQEDSGMYVCLGANTMGYSFKSAFLEVLPPVGSDGSTGTTTNPQQVNDDDESFRSTIQYVIFIAIPSIVVIIFIIMLIMYCTGCRKSSSRPPPQVRQQQPLNQLGRQEPNEHTPQNLNKPYYPTPPQSHESYPVGFDKIVNHYQDFHPPTTYSDTLNSNGSLSSSRIYHYPHMNVHQC